MLKSQKTNTLVDGLTERTTTLSISDQIEEIDDQKPCTKKMVIDEGKISKAQNEVKPVKNKKKNLQSFLKISLVQNGVPPSHKLQHHAYE